MRSIQVSGVLPATLVEGSGTRDWTATLHLAGDLAGLTGVELLGVNALAFTARLLDGFAAVVLTPGAPVDYETLAAAGRLPLLSVSLRFSFADGSHVDDPTSRSVTVLDIDDTAPGALGFASGGQVVAGAIGAVIGTLRVVDVDSIGPFLFTIAPEDDWRFEVVGSVLKLREGISLGLDDMPHRPLLIEVSDGRQSAAFTLDLTVTDPAAPPPGLAVGQTAAGLTLVDATTATTLLESRSIVAAVPQDGGGLALTLLDGQSVTLPAVTRLRFADGFVDVGAGSAGVQAASLLTAIAGHAPDATTLAGVVAAVEAGGLWVDIAAAALAQAGQSEAAQSETAQSETALTADDAAFVGALFQNALGRAPFAGELSEDLALLAGGLARSQWVVDLALGAEALGRQPVTGVWVAAPLDGAAWRGGAGGLPDGGMAPVATDMLWLV